MHYQQNPGPAPMGSFHAFPKVQRLPLGRHPFSEDHQGIHEVAILARERDRTDPMMQMGSLEAWVNVCSVKVPLYNLFLLTSATRINNNTCIYIWYDILCASGQLRLKQECWETNGASWASTKVGQQRNIPKLQRQGAPHTTNETWERKREI